MRRLSSTLILTLLLMVPLIHLPAVASASSGDCSSPKFYRLNCPKKSAPPKPAPTPVQGHGLMKTAADAPAPAPAPAAATAEPGATNELVLRIGNESNKNDGPRGPFTYGFEAEHGFRNGASVSGAYMRLHERGTPKTAYFVDELQLTLKSPETRVLGQPIVVDVTAWKNRMMDMYTNVGGVEVTRSGKVALNGGVYAGNATVDNIRGRFIGAQLGASGSLGPLEVAIAHMSGAIRTPGDDSRLGMGRYHKSGIEAAKNVNFFGSLDMKVTTTLERRHFDFADEEHHVNDPRDTYIFVTGAQVNARDLVRAAKGVFGRGAQ